MKKVSAFVVLALLLSFAVASAQVQQVTVESVTNTQDGIYLLAGNTHTISLRVTNTGTTNTYNTANGFRIFSTDGATWGNSVGAWENSFSSNFIQAYINPFSVDGAGADTLGFAGVTFLAGGGLPAGYDSVAMSITIGPTNKADNGKTICIDSSFFPPGGTWKWAPLVTTEPQVYPAWSGQQCWTVLDPDAPKGALVVDPGTLSFTAEEGGANPSTQTFDAYDQDGTNVAFTSTESSPWINLTNPNGTTPGTVTVGVDIAGLTPGTYTDSIMVEASLPQSPQYVVVSLEVTARPRELVVSPTTVNLSVMEGEASPSARIGVSEVGGDAIPYSADITTVSPWLSIPDPSGTTPDSFTVQTDITGLTPGSYSATVQVSSGTAVNSPINVTVNLEVIAAPKYLEVAPTSLTFNYVSGGPVPSPKNFTVSETGGATIPFTATPSDSWVGVNQLQANTPGTVEVTVDPTGMPIGTSISSVVVTSGDAANSPQQVNVTLIISPAPEFVVDPTSLFFTAVAGGANPGQQSVALSLSDGGTIGYSAIKSTAWLTLGNADGVTPAEITADVDITGLSAGIYTDSIVISEAPVVNGEPVYDALAAPVVVPVTLEITAAPRYIEISPDSSWYAGSTGAAVPIDGSFEVLETGGDNLPFTLSTEASWIEIVVDSGVTPVTMHYNVYPGGLNPGNYYDSIKVMAGGAENSPVYHRISLLVQDCPMLVLDTVYLPNWQFTIIEGETVSVSADIGLLSSGPVEVDWTSTAPEYFTLDQASGTTPSTVHTAYSRTFSTAGQYIDSVTFQAVPPEGNGCESNVKIFVRVTVLKPPSADTVVIGTVATRPGESIAVPVEFANSCDLYALNGSIVWTTPYLFLDSVSYVGSALTGFNTTQYIDNDNHFVTFSAETAGAPVPPKFTEDMNLWLNLYFTIDCDAQEGDYAITMPMVDSGVTFVTDCGDGQVEETPEIDSGFVMIRQLESDFCAWVLNHDESGIEGATVEVWTPFPENGPGESTMSNGHGSFALTVPSVFDLWVYKEGYYPEHVENPVRGQKIYLTPVEELIPTSMSVQYYCGSNTYLGQPLPVGSVVEVREGDRLVGRQYVYEPGLYRFLEVYRASTLFGDDGAHTDSLLTFYVNGQIAVAHGNLIYPPTNDDRIEVCLEAGAALTKECFLASGWNLVSWNVNTESDNIYDILGDYMDDIEVVLGFEQGGLTFDPSLPQFSTLWNLDHLSGYWIKVKDGATVNLSVTGFSVPVATPIAISKGWNLVSYLPETEMTPAEALNSLETGSYLLFAYGFDNGGIEVYEPGGTHNQLAVMSGCNGYWIKSTTDAVLVYPDGSIPPVAVPSYDRIAHTQIASTPSSVATTTNWVNLYSNNLTLDGKTINAGSVITAHNMNGDLVGSFTMTESGKFGFMPVYAGDGGALKSGDQFYLAVDGQATTERFDWTDNGARIEVLALSLGGGQSGLPTEYSLHQNYPNPFNPTTVIPFSMPQAGHVRVEVYNILGKLIAVPLDGVVTAGESSVEWNGRDADGKLVASGVYLYRLTADNFTQTRKMMLLK